MDLLGAPGVFVDSHAHLQWDEYKEDFNQVLANLKSAGVDLILNIGTTLETSKESVDLAQKHDFTQYEVIYIWDLKP